MIGSSIYRYRIELIFLTRILKKCFTFNELLGLLLQNPKWAPHHDLCTIAEHKAYVGSISPSIIFVFLSYAENSRLLTQDKSRKSRTTNLKRIRLCQHIDGVMMFRSHKNLSRTNTRPNVLCHELYVTHHFFLQVSRW